MIAAFTKGADKILKEAKIYKHSKMGSNNFHYSTQKEFDDEKPIEWKSNGNHSVGYYKALENLYCYRTSYRGNVFIEHYVDPDDAHSKKLTGEHLNAYKEYSEKNDRPEERYLLLSKAELAKVEDATSADVFKDNLKIAKIVNKPAFMGEYYHVDYYPKSEK